MWLEKIQLEQFRNYRQLSLEFNADDRVHLIIGDNAQGKTNFLEAILLLSMAKSFRAVRHNALIQWEQDYMRTVGTVNANNISFSLEFFVSCAPIDKKNLRKNGVDVNIKDFIGQLNSVLFQPEDLNMLYLSPSLRRKYINSVLSQTDPLYFDALINYNRLIKQRNKILALIDENKASMEELLVWDDKIGEYGSYIYRKRSKFVEYYNTILSQIYNNIAETDQHIAIEMHCSFSEVPKQKEHYLSLLQNCQSGDLRYQQTRKGPHRDDLQFFFDKRNVSDFASRGEMRTLLIALKLAEIEFLKKQTGNNPILLLDDVFSELDKKRQKALIKVIREYQSFVTTTHHDFPIDDARIIEIKEGAKR